jgi:hypothetical protein
MRIAIAGVALARGVAAIRAQDGTASKIGFPLHPIATFGRDRRY